MPTAQSRRPSSRKPSNRSSDPGSRGWRRKEEIRHIREKCCAQEREKKENQSTWTRLRFTVSVSDWTHIVETQLSAERRPRRSVRHPVSTRQRLSGRHGLTVGPLCLEWRTEDVRRPEQRGPSSTFRWRHERRGPSSLSLSTILRELKHTLIPKEWFHRRKLIEYRLQKWNTGTNKQCPLSRGPAEILRRPKI